MSVFTMEKLRGMREAMLKLQPQTPLYDNIIGSRRLTDVMADALAPRSPAANPIWGIPVRESRAFPHQFACTKCGGTGEGDDSTYCTHCKGAGQIRVEGLMGGGPSNLTMITSKLPRAFEPRWTAEALPKRHVGIRSIDWPQ
jgi:hypothetical protein